MTYDFDERLDFSMGARKASDADTIMALLDGCQSVKANDTEGDDKGIDFIATLRGGSLVNIDVKTREPGCSRYWRNKLNEPELAIEKWSVMPGGEYDIKPHRARAGWTIDESKKTDMILYTFHPSDSTIAFLLPFQSLRMASRRMLVHWLKRFKVDVQRSSRGGSKWQSQAVFVPASEVINAIETTFSTVVEIQKSDPHPELF